MEWLGSEGDQSADQAFEALSPERKAEIAVVTGHMNFGAHRLLPRPACYLTFVRHPVDRIVSHYYHVLRNPQHYLHEKVSGGKMDLAAYAASGLSIELENDQTRMIAGPGAYASDQEMLNTAFHNIENHFSCVGITERFAESLVLMAHLHGWSTPYYRDANIGGNRPRSLELSPDAIAAIEHQNQCDLELYRFAERRLDEQLAANLPDWEARVQRFLWKNRQYVRMTQASGFLRRGVGAGLRLLKIGSVSTLQSQSPRNTIS